MLHTSAIATTGVITKKPHHRESHNVACLSITTWHLRSCAGIALSERFLDAVFAILEENSHRVWKFIGLYLFCIAKITLPKANSKQNTPFFAKIHKKVHHRRHASRDALCCLRLLFHNHGDWSASLAAAHVVHAGGHFYHGAVIYLRHTHHHLPGEVYHFDAGV